MNLCFLDAVCFDAGALRGAVLVTDERTRPLEFRVTDPVAPTELQRLLCGAAFDEHVLGELIGAPLLASLRENVDLVLVRDQRLLVVQDATPQPVLWLGRDEGSDELVVGYHGGEDDRIRAARARLSEIAAGHDLLEPFARLCAAVERVHADGVAAGP
jgi:hypothetical protein